MPVEWMKEKYKVRKTKGRNNSKSNDQGNSTRKKNGAKVGNGGGMLTLTGKGKKVWSKA